MNEPGPQFIRVWRGLDHTANNPKEVNVNRLGIHWSDDKAAAERWVGGNGTLLEGYVNKRHVVPRDTSEFDIYANRNNIQDYDEDNGPFYRAEKELTIRKDSPVHIVSSTRIKTSDKRTRRKTKRPNPPIGGLT
jgi:hypothetical protein